MPRYSVTGRPSIPGVVVTSMPVPATFLCGRAVPDVLPGPRPTFFFAPDRVTKRSQDWGREGLEDRLATAWSGYVEWTGGWLEVLHGRGPQAVQEAYLDLLDGRIDPARANVLSLSP